MSAALAGALLRCPSLAVLALRRTGHLASHPAKTTSISQFLLLEYLAFSMPALAAAAGPMLATKTADACKSFHWLLHVACAFTFGEAANALRRNWAWMMHVRFACQARHAVGGMRCLRLAAAHLRGKHS